jgi:tRNA threonylcarbamoyladenosine biosynthesis protein TsaE
MIEFIHPADDSEARLRAHLPSEADTVALGAALAQVLRPGLQIWLQGNLGSGKTTLTRGVLRGLGHEGKVKSPTYTLIEPYSVSRLNLYHFDFYRFNSPDEYLEAGLDEYFSGDGVCLVEWPDKALPYLAPPDLEIVLEPASDGRRAEVIGHTDAGRTCVIELAKALRGANPTPVAE